MTTPAGTNSHLDLKNGSSCLERHWLLALTSILLLAGALRFALLGEASLWVDEIWSIGTSRMSWRAFLWNVRNQDPNMSLYYILLHGWMRLGEGEAVVRAM